MCGKLLFLVLPVSSGQPSCFGVKRASREFLRLLFLQAHRETTAHFTAIGMPAQQHCDSFRFRRAAFYNGLKSKVGLAAAKTVLGCDMPL